MNIINVKISEHEYGVYIGRDLSDEVAQLLNASSQEKKVLIVTDNFFEKTYAKSCVDHEHYKNNDSNYPYSVFCEHYENKVMHVSPRQALDLEIILNKTANARTWIELGDILFEWRLNPEFYKIECDFH